MTAPPPALVRSLAGRYTDLGLIGRGASATVWRAVDRRTESAVAIKVLAPQLRADPVGLERFRRELEITRRIGHPQVVAVYDLVVASEVTYLVMQLVAGTTLKERLERHGPLDTAATLHVVTQILEVLAACHADDVVHRDLKPQNVMVDDGLRITLLDFGVARVTALPALTQTGATLGSPEYMAPELFADGAHDPRTDLYALGAVLYELLAGEPPFAGDSLAVLYRQHLTAPVPRLAAAAAESAWLQDFVERLLAKQPHERYQTADEALADVRRRSVPARRLPRVPRRECAGCGSETIAQLPACTACGFDGTALRAPGTWQLLCTEATDRAALARWLHGVVGAEARRVQPETALVASNLTEDAAAVLRRSALRHDVVLLARRRPAFTWLRVAAAGAGLLYASGVTGIALAAIFSGREPGLVMSDRFDPSLAPTVFLFRVAQAVVFGAIAWFCLNVLRRHLHLPAVTDRRALATHAAAEAALLRDLLPAGGARDASGRLLVAMLELHLLLCDAERTPTTGARGRREELLRSAGEVAKLEAEIQRALGGMRPGTAEHGRLEQLATRLSGLLIRLHAALTAAAARTVVLRQPFEQADAQALADHAHALRRELAAAREARAELRRVA